MLGPQKIKYLWSSWSFCVFFFSHCFWYQILVECVFLLSLAINYRCMVVLKPNCCFLPWDHYFHFMFTHGSFIQNPNSLLALTIYTKVIILKVLGYRLSWMHFARRIVAILLCTRIWHASFIRVFCAICHLLSLNVWLQIFESFVPLFLQTSECLI